MLTLDSPITWRSLARIGLGFAGEYALLALIEEAPAALKIATVICAVAGLFILETESRLRKRRAFVGAIVAVCVIYFGFIGYAVNHVYQETAIEKRLHQLSVQGITFQTNPFPNRTPSMEELQQWADSIDVWKNTTATYLQDNLGDYERERFLNIRGMPMFSYGGASTEVNQLLNISVNLHKNLTSIIESRGQRAK
jgi:hypothetical protein